MIYHSSETFNPAPGAHADATADLFAIRTQDFGRVASEIHRFVSFAATQRFGSEKSARQGPTDVYDSCWFEDLKKIGAENYYRPIVP